MATRELRKLLRSMGCEPTEAAGSHEKWTTPGGYSTTIKGGAKQQTPGTLRGIQEHLEPEFGPKWLEKGRRQ